jgi:hypothetical protein
MRKLDSYHIIDVQICLAMLVLMTKFDKPRKTRQTDLTFRILRFWQIQIKEQGRR